MKNLIILVLLFLVIGCGTKDKTYFMPNYIEAGPSGQLKKIVITSEGDAVLHYMVWRDKGEGWSVLEDSAIALPNSK